jgi:3-dehydroquinate synthase
LQKSFQVVHYDVPDGEKSKSAGILDKLFDWLLDNKLERQDTIIALGGGVVGDLAGFAAASWLRGINLIHFPTSLLAQVDSSIGGKVGINHKAGKNLIGAFYQPRAIFTGISVLKTLPPEEFICGLGEVVKYGVIADRSLFELLEKYLPKILDNDPQTLQNVVLRCAAIKADIVSRDEHEAGLRAILNYGHTFGHALETHYGYTGLKHGQAVLLGMLCANYVAENLGILSPQERLRIDALIKSLPLSFIQNNAHPDPKVLLQIMYQDKKVRAGKMRLILAEQIGRAKLYPLENDQLITASFEYLYDQNVL